MTSMSTQANPPPAFSISSSGQGIPPSVLTPQISSDLIYPKKSSNWHTVVINSQRSGHIYCFSCRGQLNITNRHVTFKPVVI